MTLPIPPPPSRPGEGQGSAVDGVPRPGLVFGSRIEMGYGHLHRLDLLVLRRDGAHLVAHFITFHRHVLALDAAGDRSRCV